MGQCKLQVRVSGLSGVAAEAVKANTFLQFGLLSDAEQAFKGILRHDAVAGSSEQLDVLAHHEAAYQGLANIHAVRGKIAASLQAYTQAWRILQSMEGVATEEGVDFTKLCGGLGLHARMVAIAQLAGDAAQEAGDLSEASEWFQRARSAAEAALAERPCGKNESIDYHVVVDRIGKLAGLRGDGNAQLVAARQCVANLERLHQRFRRDQDITDRLITALVELTDALRERCEINEALRTVLRARNLIEKQMKRREFNPELSHIWENILQRIGGLYLRCRRNGEALENFEKALASIKSRIKQFGRNRDLSLNEAIFETWIGDAQRALGETAKAARAYRRSLTIKSKLADSDPDNSARQFSLFIAHERLALTALQRRKFDDAEAHVKRGASILDGVLKRSPEHVPWQRSRAAAVAYLGDCAVGRGDIAAAQKAYDTAIRRLRKLLHSSGGSPAVVQELEEVRARRLLTQPKLNKDAATAMLAALKRVADNSDFTVEVDRLINALETAINKDESQSRAKKARLRPN